jgi:hypothetical protein
LIHCSPPICRPAIGPPAPSRPNQRTASMAAQIAAELGSQNIACPADWKKHGKAAGPIATSRCWPSRRGTWSLPLRWERAGNLRYGPQGASSGNSPGSKVNRPAGSQEVIEIPANAHVPLARCSNSVMVRSSSSIKWLAPAAEKAVTRARYYQRVPSRPPVNRSQRTSPSWR